MQSPGKTLAVLVILLGGLSGGVADGAAAATKPVDLVATVTATGAAVAGRDAAFSVSVSNLGGVAAQSTVEVSLLPQGGVSGPVRASGDGWTCDQQRCATSTDLAAGSTLPPISANLPTIADRTSLSSYYARAQLSATVNGGDDAEPNNNSASATAGLRAASAVDAALTIRPPASAPTRGQTADFEAAVANVGTAPLRSRVELVFSSGLSGQGSGWTCPPASGRCVSDADVAAGASLPTLTLKSPTSSDSPTTVAYVSATIETADDPLTQNNYGSAQTPLAPLVGPDLIVRTRPGPTAREGNPATASVRVENAGAQPSNGPIELAYPADATASGPGWTCPAGAGRCVTSATVAPGSVLPDVQIRRPTTSPISSTAISVAVTGGGDGLTLNNSATQALGLSRLADPVDLVPSTTATYDPATRVATWQVDIANTGSSEATQDTTVVLETPVAYSPFGTNRTLAPRVEGDGWTCTGRHCLHRGPLAAGASLPPLRQSGTLPADATAATVYFTAAVNSDSDANTANNYQSGQLATGGVGSDLGVTVRAGGATRVGQVASGTVQVRNLGSKPVAGPVDVTMSTSTPAAGTSVSGAGWKCGSDLVCTHPGPVAVGAALPALQIATPTDWRYVGSQTIGATVRSAADEVPQNDSGTSSYGVGGQRSDLIPMLATTEAWRAGETGRTTTGFVNAGTTAQTDPVTLRISAPYASVAQGEGWSCTAALECTFDGTVAAGAAAPALEVRAPLPVNLTPTAFGISSAIVTSADDYPQNDDAYNAVPVVATAPAAGLQLRFTRDRTGNVSPGSTEHIALQVRNASASDAPGPFTVRLSPSRSIAVESVNGIGWSCDSTLLCRRTLSLAAGESAPLEISARASASASSLEALVASGRQDTRASVTATLPLPLSTLSGVDLVQDVESTKATRAGTAAEFLIRVRNGGEVSERGQVEVRLSSSGRVGGPITGSGPGWRCPAGSERCITNADVPPGAALPELTAVVAAAKGTPGSSVALRSELVGVDDDAYPENNTALARSPVVAATGADTVAQVRIQQPLRAGARALSTITVRNIGTESATDQVTLRWSVSGATASTPVATGDGWACANSRCVHDGPLAAGAALPPVSVQNDTLRQRGSYSGYATLSLGATVEQPQDAVDTNNSAGMRAPVHAASGVDLAVALRPTSDAFALDAPRRFTAVVRNTGDARATQPIEISLPTSWTASGGGWTCPRGAGRCRTSAPLDPGAELPPVSLVDPATSAQPGLATAYSTVFSDEDSESENDNAAVLTPVISPSGADLLATLQPVEPQQSTTTATYTATVRNVGAEATSGPTTVTLLPADVTAEGTNWTCDSSTCTTTSNIAPDAALPPLTLSRPVTETSPTSSASLYVTGPSDTSKANNDASATATRRLGAPAGADVRLSATLETSGRQASTPTWTLKATNDGTQTTGAPTTVSLNAPYLYGSSSRYLVPTLTGDGWTCAQTSCTRAPLAAGQTSAPLRVEMTLPSADALGQVQLSASVDAGLDANPSNNYTDTTFGVGGVRRDAIVALSSPAAVRFDEELSQHATVRNLGSAALTGPIELVITRPTSESTVVPGPGWDCNAAATCTHPGPLAPNSALPAVTITTPASRADGARSVNLTADVNAAGDDLTVDDLASMATSRGGSQIDLTTDITTHDPVHLRERASFDVTVRNGGARPSARPGTLVISAPAGSTAAGEGWVCTSTLSCSTDAVVPAAGALPPVTVSVPSGRRDDLSSVSISTRIAESDDQYSPNNDSYASTSVGGPRVDLTALVRPLGRWRAGSTATFRADIANAGSVDAVDDVDVTLNTPYPGAVATGENWVCTSNLHCLHGGPVPIGAQLPPLNVSVPIPASATPTTAYAGVSLESAEDDITSNNSTELYTGLERQLETRRAALFDAEAQRSRLPLGASTRVAIQFADGVDPQNGQISALLPTGTRLSDGAATPGLANPVTQSVTGGTRTTWTIVPAPAGTARSFDITAIPGAPVGSAVVQLELSSELTASPEIDEAPFTIVRPTISDVSPRSLALSPDQTITLDGTDFDDTHRLVLQQGARTVVGTNDVSAGSVKSALFNASSLTPGPATVQLQAADGSTLATAPASITLTQATFREPQVSLVGPTRVRINTEAFAYISVFNPSNADIRDVPLIVSVPPGVELRPDGSGGREVQAAAVARMASEQIDPAYRLSAADRDSIIARLPEAPPVTTDPTTGGKRTIVVMGRIPAGGTARLRVGVLPRVEVTAPIRASVHVNQALYAKTGYASDITAEILSTRPGASRPAAARPASGRATSSDTLIDCASLQVDAETCRVLRRGQTSVDVEKRLAQKYACVSIAPATGGVVGKDCSFDETGVPTEVAKKKFPGLSYLESIVSAFNLYGDLDDAYNDIVSPPTDTQFGVRAVDPNDKLSPAGYGSEHWISGDDAIPYTVRFENVRSATAAAQQVLVTDALPAELDASTVQLLGAEVGGVPLSLAAASTSASRRTTTGSAVLDAITGRDVLLDVSTEPASRRIEATFRGSPDLDDPISPTAFGDFLPPNNDSRAGEGSITFTARAQSGLPTGTTVRNVASIVFDPHADGPTIATPPAVNRLDRTAPTVSVPAAGGRVGSALSFATDDQGSGVAHILVTPVKDGARLTAVELPPTARSFTAPSAPGSYEFEIRVTDGVGRVTERRSAALTIEAAPVTTPPTPETPQVPVPETPQTPTPTPQSPAPSSPVTAPPVVPTPSAPQTTKPATKPTTPVPTPSCRVPKLKGKTLAAAKAAIKKAGCKTGKITRPKKTKKGAKLVVKKQSGTTKISIVLRPSSTRK